MPYRGQDSAITIAPNDRGDEQKEATLNAKAETNGNGGGTIPAVVLVIAAVFASAPPAVAQGGSEPRNKSYSTDAVCTASGGSCLREAQVMDRETSYQGMRLHIDTQRGADGKWRAQATFADQAAPAVKTAQDAYGSEQEAYTAALSAAAAQVDLARQRIGKP